MTSYISADLRRLVVTRADRICEYCLIHESDTFLGCQVDHVIAEKHGGATIAENLCFACTLCNRFKGTDVGSVTSAAGEFSRFFNPRQDRWSSHFLLDGSIIRSLTAIGEVTSKILCFNDSVRVVERDALRAIGRYPPPAATGRLTPGR